MKVEPRKSEGIPPISHEREVNQISLESYLRSYYDLNFLDESVNQQIAYLEAELKGIEEKLERLSLDKSKSYEEKLGDEISLTESLVDIQLLLVPLSEIKIIYAYKDFEVKFVRLLKAAYPEENITNAHKWNALIDFLKSRGMKTKDIVDYNLVNQLREVNNSLKHSPEFKEQIVNMVDEISSKHVSYRELLSFYERIKGSPMKFIESLKSMIYRDLYEFDEQRIQRFARSLALRMNKEQASALSGSLMAHY